MFSRIWLSDGDHCSEIEEQLPLAGTIKRKVRASDDSNLWFLLRLRSPLRYRGLAYAYALVASRWVGRSISYWRETSAFLVLVPDERMPIDDGVEIKSLRFVAWVTCIRSMRA